MTRIRSCGSELLLVLYRFRNIYEQNLINKLRYEHQLKALARLCHYMSYHVF